MPRVISGVFARQRVNCSWRSGPISGSVRQGVSSACLVALFRANVAKILSCDEPCRLSPPLFTSASFSLRCVCSSLLPSSMCMGFCLHFAVVSLDGPRLTTGCCAGCPIARGCSGLTVDLLANALHGALQVIGGTADTREIGACKRITYGPAVILHLPAYDSREFVPE